MTGLTFGHARCSTDKQDIKTSWWNLLDLGVPADRICLDRDYSGTQPRPPHTEHDPAGAA